MRRKFLKYLAIVGLISSVWIMGSNSPHNPVLETGRRASTNATVNNTSYLKLASFSFTTKQVEFFQFVSDAIGNPCVEEGALEGGWGPLRQEWFNHLDAPDYARYTMACTHNWGGDQYNCLDILWGQREDHWDTFAGSVNRAYGIPQALPASKMASEGLDWRTNPRTQIRWGLNYIESTYGSPCGALGHSYKRGWY